MSKKEFKNVSQAISQSERWFNALVPESFQIDARDLSDLIRFAAGFTSQVNYYDSTNKLDGTWKDFFTSDAYILTLLVSRLNISGYIRTFNDHVNKIKTAVSEKEKIECIKDLLAFLSKLADEFSVYHQQFTQVNNPKKIEDMLMSLRDVKDESLDLGYFYEEAIKEFGYFESELKIPDTNLKGESEHIKQIYFTGHSSRERISNAITALIELFNKLNAKFNHLVDAAKRFVSKHGLNEQQYLPQIGVFIAFLNLYTHLQKKINGISRRHLDFYFKELLALQLNKGIPDKVHLIIDPADTTENLQITTGDLLLAEIKGKAQVVNYQLESDILLNAAQVAEVKTIFLSNFAQIISNSALQYDVMETQVYQAEHDPFVPALYFKNPAAAVTWAALGEDQRELTGNMRSMEDTELGLLLGSPLFYLPEGDRVVKLKIHFKPESFDALVDYILNFSAVSGQKIESSIHDLLSNAFQITYTSTEKWETAKDYSVKCDIENKKDRMIEIILRLRSAAPAFDIYQQNLHQLSIETALPVLYIGLNNFAEHHAFSFFRNSLIERITIRVDVKGFKSIKLQNNIGVLSPASPFQIFGPLPTLGSFLDIKNANLFNCFTKDIRLNIEWLDLPRDKGGFETYYKGYPAPFYNHSFEVSISSVNRGSRTPEPEYQQRKKMFALQNGGNYLESRNSISDIDFSKIEFLNSPALTAEDNIFSDGLLRLEFSSPPETFGHRLFPQIFPEAVMNKAKKGKNKQALPNPPIIPIVKSISVDYALEYSETFNEGNTIANNTVELFHKYPFGYENIYPGSDQKNISFMPRIENEGNLLIGLKNVEPGTELSLFFQLEDRTFHHTLHEPDIIIWTYLENNRWVNFKTKDVLSDSTYNFISSGIVKLKLPHEIPTNNTILNPNLLWIRASSDMSKGVSPRIIGIATNGVTAVRISGPVAEHESDLRIAPGTIKSFVRTMKGVQQVWQLFTSFDGRPPERSDKYYVRISERLRHKQRPVHVRDIIQVVLEKFPEILIVKCFNTSDQNLMVTPGTNLQLILIPKELKTGGLSNEQPQISLATLYKVKTFLSEITSPFIQIEVGNPVYEKVKIICKVLFSERASVTSGTHLHQLITDINQHIAPWLFKDKEDVMIGNRIYKSDILMFIKTRPYVDYVSAFSVVHFFDSKNIVTNELDAHLADTAYDGEEYITCSSPGSVLIPSSNHIITLLEEPVFEQAGSSGIGNLIIGDELLISDPENIVNTAGKTKTPETGEDDEQFSLIITHNI